MASKDPIACLGGTPYLLPHDVAASKELADLVKDEASIARRLKAVRTKLSKANLREEAAAMQTTREIFESNQIEGLGPDISGTWDVLQGQDAAAISEAIDQKMMVRAITGDADMRAVLTLHGARLLARQLTDGIASGRPMTETDLRGIHTVICAGEGHEGAYKRYHVLIGGENAHEPHLPVDVGSSMHELVDWFRADAPGSGVLRAAATHAWLTHIHPFEDGNGRLARLLANVALAQAGLPPAIVKSATQRAPYLDALRHSDGGGDILPLAGLFMGTLRRYIKEVERPAFLRNVFREELKRRGSTFFDWWSREFEDFVEQLNAELSLRKISVRRAGRMDFESFQQIRNLSPEGNTWLQVIRDEHGGEILMWFGYPTQAMRQRMSRDLRSPSVYLSVPAPSWSLHRYERGTSAMYGGLRELAIMPGVPSKVYTLMDDFGRDRLRAGGFADAADEVASLLAKGLTYQEQRRQAVGRS